MYYQRKNLSSMKDFNMKIPILIYRRENGFTLLELLVTIALIMLLASMLLPALTNAKMLSKRMACASNVKQILLSWNLYTTDSSGLIPSFTMGSGGEAGGQRFWHTMMRDYLGDVKITDSYGSTCSNPGILFCPSQNNKTTTTYYSSYGMTRYAAGGGDYSINYRGYKSVSQIKYPSEQLLFADSMYTTPSRGWYLIANLISITCIHIRHGRYANLGFPDGHVSPFTYEEITIPYPDWLTGKLWGWPR